MICTKCNIDKPIEQYETYWHSTQNKMRTRKYCRDCCKEQRRLYKESINMKKITQPVSPEPPTIDYSTNPNYYNCIDCKEWKLLTDFYLHKGGKPITKRCKACQKILDQKEADEKRRDNGGSMMVPKYPNVYFDHYQKENTFELMKLFGYLFDEENGIWWKPGVKEVVDGKPVFLKIKKGKRRISRPRHYTKELMEQILLFRSKNWTYRKIGMKLNISETTVRKYLVDYGNEAC